MIDFYNEELGISFSLEYNEFDILKPIFDEFHRKTGLSIDEYGDTRLIIDNLSLIKNIAIDFGNQETYKNTRVLIQSFIRNLETITKRWLLFFGYRRLKLSLEHTDKSTLKVDCPPNIKEYECIYRNNEIHSSL